jgi:hypothetical protein
VFSHCMKRYFARRGGGKLKTIHFSVMHFSVISGNGKDDRNMIDRKMKESFPMFSQCIGVAATLRHFQVARAGSLAQYAGQTAR